MAMKDDSIDGYTYIETKHARFHNLLGLLGSIHNIIVRLRSYIAGLQTVHLMGIECQMLQVFNDYRSLRDQEAESVRSFAIYMEPGRC